MVEMNWRVLSFVELISNLRGKDDFFISPGALKFSAPLGFSLDVLLDDLVNRDVEHVVLDSKVGASGVNTESFLVIDQNNLWLE